MLPSLLTATGLTSRPQSKSVRITIIPVPAGVTDAYGPLEFILVGLCHFREESQSVRPTRSEKPKGIINFLSQINQERPNIWAV